MPTYTRSPRFVRDHAALNVYSDPVRPGEAHIEWLGLTADHSLYQG